MKKAIVLLIVLAFVGAAYAQDAAKPSTAKGTGLVSLYWGYDLDNGTSGFKYGLDNVMIAFGLPTDVKASATGTGVYGTAGINNIHIDTVDTTLYGVGDGGPSSAASTNGNYLALKWDGIFAKLVINDLTIGYYDWGAPSTTVDMQAIGQADWGIGSVLGLTSPWLQNAWAYQLCAPTSRYYGGDLENTKAEAWADDDTYTRQYFPGSTVGNWSIAGNAGVEATYAIKDVANVGLRVLSYKAFDDASRFDYSDINGTTLNTTNGDTPAQGDNSYIFRPAFSLKAVPDLTFDVAGEFAIGRLYDQPMFGGAKLGYNVKISDDIVLLPQVAADFYSLGSTLQYGVTGGLKATLFKSVLTAYAAMGNKGTLTAPSA